MCQVAYSLRALDFRTEKKLGGLTNLISIHKKIKIPACLVLLGAQGALGSLTRKRVGGCKHFWWVL